MKQSLFIKVSGDCLSKKFLSLVKELSQKFFIVICVGGGTQINEEFKKRGKKIEFGPSGREIEIFEDRQLARDILEKNQAHLQDALLKAKIHATVIIPVLDMGSVLCHVNGDNLIRDLQHNFNKSIVITTKDRLTEKKKQFAGLLLPLRKKRFFLFLDKYGFS